MDFWDAINPYGVSHDKILKLHNLRACISHKALLYALSILGRYNKYSRELSQTPWIIDGVRKTEYSVEERVCELLDKKVQCSDHKFSSSGREDVDVRMLGRGRPFMIEFIKPKIVTFLQEELTKIQKQINADTTDVQVRDLQLCNKDDTGQLIKAGEMTTCKSYSALCWMKEVVKQTDLDKLKEIEVC
jgi:tRNA pseudouridine synthase 10